MESQLKPGLTHQKEELVTFEKTAAAVGSGLVEVYATPAMIAFMENTSSEMVVKYLPEGDNTVGSEVNITHVKPTAVGKKVYCESTITQIEGRKISFKVRAWDEQGEIGHGTHTRFIINTERFMNKVMAS
ncbi:MAG: thioesterase family protein [Cyclobacteriaceae bacterium]|nr:thioesterase family protein [Cyclobacteriaceae bacterium]